MLTKPALASASAPGMSDVVAATAAERLRRYCWVWIVGLVVFRHWFNGLLPISGDEAYHWSWSRHLEAAFHDHGGVLGASVWLAGQLLDPHSERCVRLAALIYMALTLVVGAAFARRVARERGGDAVAVERAGLLAAVTLTLPPVFAVLQGYNVTDPPAVFFTLWTLDLAHRALASRRTVHWLLVGVAMAAAAQSKFLTLGLLPAAVVLLAVLRAPERPKVRQLVAAVAAMVVGLLPLLLWNAQNDWETFRFNFFGRHDDDMGWRWLNLPEFVGGQLVAISPLLAIVAAAALWTTSRRLRTATVGECVLAVGAGVPIVLLALMCGVRTVGIHWTASAWAPALVLAAAIAAVPGAVPAWPGPATWRWSLRVAAVLFGLLHLLPLAPEILLRLNVGGVGRGGQIHTRKVAELWGWQDLADEALRRRAELARNNTAGAFVMTNQFGVAGLLQFYSHSTLDPKLWCFVKDHGESVRRWQDLPTLRGQDAVFVIKREVVAELPKLREHFASVGEPQELVIHHEGVAVRSFWLVECHGYDGREPYPLGPH